MQENNAVDLEKAITDIDRDVPPDMIPEGDNDRLAYARELLVMLKNGTCMLILLSEVPQGKREILSPSTGKRRGRGKKKEKIEKRKKKRKKKIDENRENIRKFY